MYKTFLDGKVKYRASYKDPLTGKYKEVSVMMDKDTAQNRRTAQEVLDRKIEKAIGLYKDRDLIKLSELIDAYREDQKRTVAQSTYLRNYYQGETFKALFGADTLVSSLNAGFVRKQMADCSPTTYNEHLKRFKAFIRWAYRNDYVEDIKWLDKLDTVPDRVKKERLKDKYLEMDEIEQLLSAMKHPIYQRLTRFLILSGLRCGEAIALQVEDIGETVVSVSKTLNPVTLELTPPKTDCSNREVYIQEELREVIDEQLAYKQAMLLGRKSPFFFCQDSGKPVSFAAYSKYLRDISAEAIGRPVSSHICRHTHVSILAAQGVPLETIMRRVGHENSSVTRDVYLHVTKAVILRDNEFLDRVSTKIGRNQDGIMYGIPPKSTKKKSKEVI